MQFITPHQLQTLLSFPKLVNILETAFQKDINVPLRHHHQYSNPTMGVDSTLLLMPAWQTDAFLGLKIVTVSPNNSRLNLPSIQGIYLLFDAKSGSLLAQMDAKLLTVKRTAAASALAARFLSRADSKTLFMIGTGNLAPHLIAAHASIRPIERVLVWGRNSQKAQAVVEQFPDATFSIEVVENIETGIAEADIISCATLSEQPLVFGKWLKAGQHIDLVGSYLPHAREADDEVMRRATIFVDTLEGAIKESGDLVIPLRNGIIKMVDVKTDLFGLCRKEHRGRKTAEEITVFKSVGHGLEDLAAAEFVYEKLAKS
ncbi:MAG: ornithine cyclodeaminase family protein [Saprospiraceae bacterium]